MNERVGTKLSGWDAATFRTAAGDPTLRSTVIACVIFDQAPAWPGLRERFERLTRLVPALRMRPLYGALGVSAPRMALDPDFDLDVHLHRYRLAPGGGWPELLADARRLSLIDFDQHRPLWEAALIEGLPDGEAALLLKMHHSIADGQATVMMAASLFELTPNGNPGEDAMPPAPQADDANLAEVTVANVVDNVRGLAGAAFGLGRTAIGLVKGTVTDPRTTWSRAVETVSSIGKVAEMPSGPLSPLMSGRGTTYTFGAFSLPFAGIRSAAKANGMSVNDVFMAAVGAGLDRYHLRHDVVVDELRVNVPVSLRGDPGDRSAQAANAVAIARFPYPIAGLSVPERMASAHALVEQWRSEPAMRLADPLAQVSWFVPMPMLASAAQASDVTTSNVPGPPIPFYLCGARVVATYPLVATIGAAVNITMVTYDGSAFIGISTDDRAVPDHDALVADLRAGFAAVAGEPVGPADRYAADSYSGDSHSADS